MREGATIRSLSRDGTNRIYMKAVDFPALTVTVKLTAIHYGGVTASTEVIAVKRHTGVRASVIVRKNTIANQNLAYAA